MGSAGYINISCIFWVIKKNRVQIIPHRDNYCMKKVIELLITLCAHCRRLWLKDKGKEKWKPKTSRLYFWCLSCIKSYYLSLCFILRERLFSPCTLNKITKLAPHWIWTSCLLLQKTTSDLNKGTFISWNISGSEIQPLRRKGMQIFHQSV